MKNNLHTELREEFEQFLKDWGVDLKERPDLESIFAWFCAKLDELTHDTLEEFNEFGLNAIDQMIKNGTIPRTTITRMRGKDKISVELTDMFFSDIEAINSVLKMMDEHLLKALTKKG